MSHCTVEYLVNALKKIAQVHPDAIVTVGPTRRPLDVRTIAWEHFQKTVSGTTKSYVNPTPIADNAKTPNSVHIAYGDTSVLFELNLVDPPEDINDTFGQFNEVLRMLPLENQFTILTNQNKYGNEFYYNLLTRTWLRSHEIPVPNRGFNLLMDHNGIRLYSINSKKSELLSPEDIHSTNLAHKVTNMAIGNESSDEDDSSSYDDSSEDIPPLISVNDLKDSIEDEYEKVSGEEIVLEVSNEDIKFANGLVDPDTGECIQYEDSVEEFLKNPCLRHPSRRPVAAVQHMRRRGRRDDDDLYRPGCNYNFQSTPSLPYRPRNRSTGRRRIPRRK